MVAVRVIRRNAMVPSVRGRFGARLVSTGLAIAVVSGGLAACASPRGGDSAQGTVVFQPATESMAVLTQLGAFATDSFSKAGLKITYNTPIPNAAQAAQSVTGNADIAIVGSSGVLPGVAAGRDIVTVATLTKGPTTQITLRDEVVDRLGVAKDAPMAEKMAALKGLSLALPQPGSTTDIATREALRLYGIDPDKDLTIRPITEPSALVTAMREGQVDGFAFSAPTSVQPVAEGYASVWLSLSDVPDLKELPYIDVVTSKAFLEKRREDVVTFVRVLSEAAQTLSDDPDSVKGAVRDKYFADLDPATFDLAWAESLPTATRGIEPSKAGFEALIALTEHQTGDSVDIGFDELYDLSVVKDLG
jgi:sulfonate transport system substrate-binding protein